MSTVADRPANKSAPAAPAQPQSIQTTVWEFTPFMAKEPIKLSLGIVKSFVATPTKSGALPHDRDIVRFITLCKARGLNPFEGDAYLVGYDAKDGPSFSLITAHQALIKRAEVHPEYDGMESGVLVDANGQIVYREGAFFLESDRLLGAWATVYFKDRSHPMKKTIKLSVYNTGRSRWAIDPAGMAVKVAEAAALRASFPNTLGGMYLREEYSEDGEVLDMAPVPDKPRPTSLDALADRLMPNTSAQNGNGSHAEDAIHAESQPSADELAADLVRFKEACERAETVKQVQDADEALRGPNGRQLTDDEATIADVWRDKALDRVRGGKGERSNAGQKEFA